MCNNKDIKDFLPAYLEEGLGPDEKLKVESHLGSCEDCRDELALLRMMAEETVPDPGEAFWASMPGRVRRAVQEQQSKKVSALARLAHWMFLPRWAWATAATIGIVAMTFWLLVRPPAVDISRTALPENGSMLEDTGLGEPLNVEEFSSTEFAAATQWAQNEFAPIGEAISEDAPENMEQDISEDLSDLSPRELDRVYEMLKKKEQDAREKLRKKRVKEKSLG